MRNSDPAAKSPLSEVQAAATGYKTGCEERGNVFDCLGYIKTGSVCSAPYRSCFANPRWQSLNGYKR